MKNLARQLMVLASLGLLVDAAASITAEAAFLVTSGPTFTVNPDNRTGAATVRASFNGVPDDPNTIYFWSVASGPSPITCVPNNVRAAQDCNLTFSAAGTYQLSVKMTDSVSGSSF